MPKQTTTYYGGDRGQMSASDVADIARRVGFGVPVGWIVGVASRESGFKANQIDTDYDLEGNPREAKTYGLCMITREEAIKSLSLSAISPEDLLDPETNIKVMCTMAARLREALSVAASNEYTEEDMLRYMCWAHNAGLGIAKPGGCVASVVKYGLDWNAAVSRNMGSAYFDRLTRYTDEVISYVNAYPDTGVGSDDTLLRLLFLALAGWAGWAYYLRA